MVETLSGKMQDTSEERLKTEESAKPQPSATIGRDASADPVVLNPNIDIPKYDGTEDPRPWIESLEEIGFLYHWAEYIISRYAAMNMIGSVKTWLDLHKISFTSWEHFKSRLIQDFGSDANKEELKMRLNRMQQWNEPAIRFAEDILVLCNKVDPQMEEENKINRVIGGLKKEYSFALYLNPPKNTNELLRLFKKMDLFENNYQESIEKSKALYNGPRSPRSHHQEQWKNAQSFRRPDQNTSKPQAPAPRGPLPENEWDEDYERLFLNQIIDEKDDFIENIKENLSGNKRSITQNFKEENGCLYKKNPNPEGREWLLVVPKKRRKEIMSEYHNHMLNGHLGVARTTYRLKNKYYWPSMLKGCDNLILFLGCLKQYSTNIAHNTNKLVIIIRKKIENVLRTCKKTSTYVFPRDAAERGLGCTETFDFSTPNEWPKWRKRFERYLVVSGMKKKEEADKIDLFMYLMGDRADDIFRTFKFEKEEEATKIDSVLKAFDSHFCVRKNIIYERAKFNSRIQEDREPVDEFITSLYKLADSCEFEGLHDQLIRDRIVVGVRDKALSERMQLDSELTLEKAMKMVRQQEAVRQQQVDLQRPSTSQKVNQKIMGQQRLVKSDINLRAAEFSELQTVGMFISTLRNGSYEINEIYVIRRLSEPLLSRRACELLNLARRIEVVATRINPIKEFPEVFEGLGQIGNPYEIKLKPGAKPYAVHTPRRVPIPLMEKLKTRLEELEKAGIIAQVNVATEWCAPTVIAGKPNGDIRFCVDLSRLNEHVQREVHPMPVVEHMLGQLGEARFFSKLDANSGFHQIPLSPDCQHLTTFITPFGRYKYCRMPFGISLAPEYFQRVMSIILQGMDGVMCYLDDILIFASDSKTHDRILRLVLRKLKEAKVTLNKAKCVFGVPRINFLGHILDEDGIRPDPAKIEAVAKMPAPTDVHGVRRFLGMVNHLGRFVENLSEIVAPLNQLLVKGQDFVWDCSQERAFRKLKELLTTQPILAAYDVRKPTMVSSDASSYGLGAVLKQEGKNGIWRPVAYSSRTMTPTEKRYAQIEKEALAITWACERFQDFLLGKRFRIETDHKPLIPLFSTKELSSLTPRLQRFRMRMMRFGFEIVHIPGKELLDADALSRQPLLTTEGGENERQTSAHINAVLSSITDKDEMLTKIFEAQQEDTTLKAVVNYLEQGWPDKKKMSQALLSYWHVKDELGVQNGLLMRSCRLVIPASMKLEILDKLHAGHFGITKTRLRARETVWWPGISEEIAETVRKCSVCIQEAVSKHEPLIPTNFPTRPWQKIGMYLFKFENKWYLVVIDYYSRFPEVVQLDRLTANVVVRSCKSIFARHGIPETVVSDNGTQFGAAREFANIARQYGFTHVTSSPRFPQSNGMAEAGVKIAKLILKKNQDPSLGLLEYRSTPLENGYSPAELLMGRKLRTTLPIAPENLNPRLVDSQTLKRKEGRRRKDMKSRYDRRCGATDMEELSEGDTVWITDMRIWGIVKKKASTPRSYMVDTPVGTLRRNRFHLRKGVTVQYPADPSTPTFSGEELVENEKTPVVDYPSNDSED
ncbi:K02A2.6-like, partial [Cordylochernes scorpioides]